MIRYYNVGGMSFGLELDSPWTPMIYSGPVLDRIARAAAGHPLSVLPVRAGDKVPSRTFIQSRDELAPALDPHGLDLSQFEPFFITDPEDVAFRLVIHSPGQKPSGMDSEEGLIMDVKDAPPFFRVYKRPDGTWFKISSEGIPSLGTLIVSNDHVSGHYYPEQGMTARRVASMLDLLLRLMCAYRSPEHSMLLMHSSVIGLNGEAVMFIGSSGTGKSTHSRLWLENVKDSELLNDDNPVVRVEDGKLFVYGTPWSGKTPCYRKVSMPVKAIVRLRQAPHNSITRVNGLYAYADLAGAVSFVRWERDVMDVATRLASQIAMSVPVFLMDCLPDAEAAVVCHDAIWH